MDKEKRIGPGLRLAAFLIDVSFLFGLSIVVHRILQLVPFYVAVGRLFAFFFICYFPGVTCLHRTTLGKALCRLRVEYNGRGPYAVAVVLRETVYRMLLVFIVPVYLIKALDVGGRFDHLSGIFHFLFSEYMHVLYLILAVFVLLVLYIASKKTWYDALAGTRPIRAVSPSGRRRHVLAMVLAVLLGAGSVMALNHLRHGHVNGRLVPRCGRSQIASYADFLKERQSAKDYIFNLFEDHDIVVICERLHYEMTQYDFYYEVISDPRFVEHGGAVFTETGGVNYQGQLDGLMQTDGLDETALDKGIGELMKNCSVSWPVWDKTNLFVHLKKLYRLNQTLPKDKQIRHCFTDIAFSWYGMTARKYREEARPLAGKRDAIMAENFIRQYEEILAGGAERTKCLVIMNYRHGFGPAKDKEGELVGRNAGAFIMDRYPERSANVLINTVGLGFDLSEQGISVSAVQGGAWDNAFAANGNRPVGFDLQDSPFGRDHFDMTIVKKWKRLRYQDVFTGFVFYKPLEEHVNSMGFTGILSDNFDKTIMERAAILGAHAEREFGDKLRLLRESETVTGYASYAALRSRMDGCLSAVVLLAGVFLSTWKYWR